MPTSTVPITGNGQFQLVIAGPLQVTMSGTSSFYYACGASAPNPDQIVGFFAGEFETVGVPVPTGENLYVLRREGNFRLSYDTAALT